MYIYANITSERRCGVCYVRRLQSVLVSTHTINTQYMCLALTRCDGMAADGPAGSCTAVAVRWSWLSLCFNARARALVSKSLHNTQTKRRPVVFVSSVCVCVSSLVFWLAGLHYLSGANKSIYRPRLRTKWRTDCDCRRVIAVNQTADPEPHEDTDTSRESHRDWAKEITNIWACAVMFLHNPDSS